MKSQLPGGVEIRMVVNDESQRPKKKLSLDDIIIAGLEQKPQATNYKCTKAFAELYHQQPRHNSIDMEQQASPGDSDYESAQEVMTAGQLPFKIRKNVTIQPIVPSVKKDPQQVGSFVDSQIQKSIKDFFTATS